MVNWSSSQLLEIMNWLNTSEELALGIQNSCACQPFKVNLKKKSKQF